MKIRNVITIIIFFYIDFVKTRIIIHQKKIILEESLVSFCKFTNPENYLLELKSLIITPNPPVQGKNITIEASGILKKGFSEGSYALLKVKYEFIPLISVQEDLCTQVY
ncbi:hypothetical protein PMAC_002950 [Pneumocystis sp. 'macacae']|nr:hypothetical protein PMAC_002950 [Pneumocystis sp. 'macacae']